MMSNQQQQQSGQNYRNYKNQNSSLPSSQYPSLPQNFIKELQQQKFELNRIKQQQLTMSSIDETIRNKNHQILRLQSIVQSYKKYYQKYQSLKDDYTDKVGRLTQKQKEAQILLKQLEQLLGKNSSLEKELMTSEAQRTQLIKDQHKIQEFNLEIQATFKMYQEECHKKQKDLLTDLEKAYKQIVGNFLNKIELNKRIDGYQMKAFENSELRKALQSQRFKRDQVEAAQALLKRQLERQKDKTIQSEEQNSRIHQKYQNNSQNFPSNTTLEKFSAQISNLKNLLNQKQVELTKYKILNNQLSIEFDKSVGKICDFQKQLSQYRRQNHELKKTLSLFIEKQQYQKLHLRQLQKQTERQLSSSPQNHRKNQHNYSKGQLAADESQQSEEDSVYQQEISKSMHSNNKFLHNRKPAPNAKSNKRPVGGFR